MQWYTINRAWINQQETLEFPEIHMFHQQYTNHQQFTQVQALHI
jgi:hypothetical protein